MGEAVLRSTAEKKGINIYVDSAGTAAYHSGDQPDKRTISTCAKFGIPIKHRARQIVAKDFTTFTHILAADESNLRDLMRIKPKDSTAQVTLWGDDEAIEDPYYGGIAAFETCYHQCTKFSNTFLDRLQ